MNRLILAHRQKLDHLFAQVATLSSISDQGEWSKYLCVLVSGFVEESLRVLLEEYCSTKGPTSLQRFISRELSEITNCKTGKIASVLNRFDPTWETEFLQQIQAKSLLADEIKNALDSVVSNRHLIAHGKSVGRVRRNFRVLQARQGGDRGTGNNNPMRPRRLPGRSRSFARRILFLTVRNMFRTVGAR